MKTASGKQIKFTLQRTPTWAWAGCAGEVIKPLDTVATVGLPTVEELMQRLLNFEMVRAGIIKHGETSAT